MVGLLTEQDFEPEGILNSTYKKIVKCSFSNMSKHSLFGIKQRIKNRQYTFTSQIEVALKVLIFVLLFIIIFS